MLLSVYVRMDSGLKFNGSLRQLKIPSDNEKLATWLSTGQPVTVIYTNHSTMFSIPIENFKLLESFA